MTRKQARENAFVAMFSLSFGEDEQGVLDQSREDGAEHPVDAFGEGVIRLYEKHPAEVDKAIGEHLKGWTMERIQKVNLAILRLSVAEILYGGPDMDSVIINEAVELAKKFGDEEDYQFVNGILGSISRQKDADARKEEG